MKGITILTARPIGLAKRALKARLFVNREGWTLREDLEMFGQSDTIALAVDKGQPIGVCVGSGGSFLSAYVKPKYRRLGVGSKLVECVKGMHHENDFRAGLGVSGSWQFWKSVNVWCGD